SLIASARMAASRSPTSRGSECNTIGTSLRRTESRCMSSNSRASEVRRSATTLQDVLVQLLGRNRRDWQRNHFDAFLTQFLDFLLRGWAGDRALGCLAVVNLPSLFREALANVLGMLDNVLDHFCAHFGHEIRTAGDSGFFGGLGSRDVHVWS